MPRRCRDSSRLSSRESSGTTTRLPLRPTVSASARRLDARYPAPGPLPDNRPPCSSASDLSRFIRLNAARVVAGGEEVPYARDPEELRARFAQIDAAVSQPNHEALIELESRGVPNGRRGSSSGRFVLPCFTAGMLCTPRWVGGTQPECLRRGFEHEAARQRASLPYRRSCLVSTHTGKSTQLGPRRTERLRLRRFPTPQPATRAAG